MAEAYLEDILTDLAQHHQRQMQAMHEINSLLSIGDDFLPDVKTRKIAIIKEVLSEINCSHCKELSANFIGNKKPVEQKEIEITKHK